ncbi:endoglucanase [Piromyces finnis]|uniref:Endoglucanase n=1 Tax=Piromyces finnis TaxID=1754191 RepID=A0A1Y1UWZ7_9FUNG|nr:endoglucanase [Piromyces finnis]|eukprot:ORX42694.1 endoglucanase [Piromyces finnis]
MKLNYILLLLSYTCATFSLTTQEVIKEMGFGWNLGNTLEACGDWINGSTVKQYETAWGNPVTTEEIIKGVKSYGFNTVRVPVAWSNLMLDNYIINPLLLSRVKEVVDYIVNNDMYAIVNIHWDMGWFTKFATNEKEAFKKYTSIWGQISQYFKDYDEHLVFESLNEEGCWDEIWNQWSNQGDKKKAFNLLNNINQEFVDIFRNSSENNAKRHLLLAGYCTSLDLTSDELYVIPKDDRVMISVHYYGPSTFTILEEDADWGKAAYSWGTEKEINYLVDELKKIKKNFIDKGIPIIVGEYGTAITNKEPASVIRWLKTVAKTTSSFGMVPCLWDAGQYFDREKLVFKNPAIGELFKQLSSALKQNNNLYLQIQKLNKHK